MAARAVAATPRSRGGTPAETQRAAAQPAETQSAETQSAETQPAETQLAEAQPAGVPPRERGVAATARAAIDAMRRGVVAYSSLTD